MERHRWRPHHHPSRPVTRRPRSQKTRKHRRSPMLTSARCSHLPSLDNDEEVSLLYQQMSALYELAVIYHVARILCKQTSSNPDIYRSSLLSLSHTLNPHDLAMSTVIRLSISVFKTTSPYIASSIEDTNLRTCQAITNNRLAISVVNIELPFHRSPAATPLPLSASSSITSLPIQLSSCLLVSSSSTHPNP